MGVSLCLSDNTDHDKSFVPSAMNSEGGWGDVWSKCSSLPVQCCL